MRLLRRVGGAVVAAAALAAAGSVGTSQASAENGQAGATTASGASVVRPAARTGYFNTYADVAKLGNAQKCGEAQGFAVGTKYTYAVKINHAESKAVIYRTRMSTGRTTLMRNGDTGSSTASYLGHANDVVLSETGGHHYMYVVTMKAGSTSLVKLKYVGATFYKVGHYTIKYHGAKHAMSGVKITSKTASSLHFLFKSGRSFYRGTLPRNARSGSINLRSAFTLDIAHAKVHGKTVPHLSSYLFQGFGYRGNTVYVPLTHHNVSIVLVYRHVSSASGTIKAAGNLSFRITSKKYSKLFEIETVGVGAGHHLWFATNRKTSASDTAHDGVHYFKRYTA